MAVNVQEGALLEDAEVLITDGKKQKLSSLAGSKGLVLYFYPKDDTPGCTTEACDFRDNNSVLAKMGYQTTGVSSDSIDSHQKFTKNHKLNFPLIADTDRKLAASLGVYGDKSLYGRIMQGISRTTFVLDPKLKILKVYKNVRAKGHVERLCSDLKDL